MILLDSNIIIYNSLPSYQNLRRYLQEREPELCASYISKVEVLGYHKLTDIEKHFFSGFFSEIALISISKELLEKAIHFRQNAKISLGDSIIAATAVVYDIPLLTNNESDFQHIAEIKLVPMSSL